MYVLNVLRLLGSEMFKLDFKVMLDVETDKYLHKPAHRVICLLLCCIKIFRDFPGYLLFV